MATKLRAIEGQGGVEDFGLAPHNNSADEPVPAGSTLGHPVLRRPGDHIETLWMKDGGVALRGLREAARHRQLHPDTAAAIVLERRLVTESLADLSDCPIDRLNHLSASQRPEVELWSAHSAYISHLLHGARSGQSSWPQNSAKISVPIRLIDRLAGDIPGQIEPPNIELRHAVNWEIAALLRGETLSEWAYRSALKGGHRALAKR